MKLKKGHRNYILITPIGTDEDGDKEHKQDDEQDFEKEENKRDKVEAVGEEHA